MRKHAFILLFCLTLSAHCFADGVVVAIDPTGKPGNQTNITWSGTATGNGLGVTNVQGTNVVGLTKRRVVSAAYASTVTPNANTTDLLIVGELTGNITIAAPTGTPTDGQYLALRLIQDGTGGRTVTFNSVYHLPATGSFTYSAAANSMTRFLFEWNAANSTWDVTGDIPGF